MDSSLYTVARVLARFEFTIADYDADGGESVVKQAMEYYSIHGGVISEDIYNNVARYITCRYNDMRESAIQWHRPLPFLFSGDDISFIFQGITVSGSVRVSPKSIGLIMHEPFSGLKNEIRLPPSIPFIFTQEPEDGSAANSEGVDCARLMLERLFFNHYKKA